MVLHAGGLSQKMTESTKTRKTTKTTQTATNKESMRLKPPTKNEASEFAGKFP